MPKSKKAALSAKETVRVIARLFDLYGIDRSLNRDRSRNGERFEQALYCAVRDGLLRLPRKRGARSKWTGKLGLELVQAIESLRVPRVPRRKPLSVAKAVEALRERHPKKWAHHLDLEKRFYEAKKFWSYTRRLAIWADRWHANHPEN